MTPTTTSLQMVIREATQEGFALSAISDTPTLSRPGSDHPRFVARLGLQAAEALEYAHTHGVLHRDIKPSNLLLDGSGCLWVTDFGLARMHSDLNLTRTGDLLGTPRYMSPEQALGRSLPLDGRTDTYALGATLYELLTLRPVFEGENRIEVLRRITEGGPIPPRRINPSIPADLETIVLKAMAKLPEDRYATATEMAEDLRRFLDDRPILARRPTLVERTRRWARHECTLARVALLGLLLLTSAGAMGSWGGSRGHHSDAALPHAPANRPGPKSRTEQSVRTERRLPYAALLQSVIRDLEAGDARHAQGLLQELEPDSHQNQEREFVWNYLWRQAGGDAIAQSRREEGARRPGGLSRQGMASARKAKRRHLAVNVPAGPG